MDARARKLALITEGDIVRICTQKIVDIPVPETNRVRCMDWAEQFGIAVEVNRDSLSDDCIQVLVRAGPRSDSGCVARCSPLELVPIGKGPIELSLVMANRLLDVPIGEYMIAACPGLHQGYGGYTESATMRTPSGYCYSMKLTGVGVETLIPVEDLRIC